MVTYSKDDDDGFLTTLHALQKVIQPADELYKQVHTLQKENRTLFEKLEALRQESQEQLQAVQEESRAKLQQQEKKWQETIQAFEEQSREASLQFETDLVKKTERMKEMELERRAILEKSEEEQKAFEESMIQLESENKNLKERCAEAEKMGSKLQTELNQRTHAFEQSKVAMQKTRKLLSDTESNAAEINKYKETTRVTQSTIAELENKLDEREREVNSLKAKVSAWEKDAATSKAEYESKLAISARASEKAIKEKEANLHQELQEQKTAYTALEEQHETEVTEWRKNQSQKDALLEAREKMYNLVKAKSESFQKKETAMKQQLKQAQTALSEANTKHSADIASLQEELEEIKDELKCAEEEVKRYRQSQSSSSKVEAKLKETEKELAAAMAMVASMEKQAQVKQESKVSEDHSINEDKDVTTEQLSSLQLELEEKNKAIVTLKEQLQSQSSGFKSQLLKKDSLLQAENVMLKLVTEKSEAMEAEQARLTQEIHDSEAALVSTKEELGKLKQELKQARDSLSLASQLQFKLEETEKKLALATANATFVAENVDNEASEREREAKLAAEQVQTEDLNTKGAEHVCLQQQLDEKEKECLILKEQLQLETQELKNKLSKKDELLKAKEKMIKLVTAKSESLQKNEASSKRAAMDAKKALEEAVAKHVAEMASYKEEMDDIKDELKYAQQEVSRCRSELKESESQVRVNETLEPRNNDKPPSIQNEVAGTEDISAESDQVEQTGAASVDDSSSKKRPADDDSSSSNALDTMKANLLAAKSRRSKKKKG